MCACCGRTAGGLGTSKSALQHDSSKFNPLRGARSYLPWHQYGARERVSSSKLLLQYFPAVFDLRIFPERPLCSGTVEVWHEWESVSPFGGNGKALAGWSRIAASSPIESLE